MQLCSFVSGLIVAPEQFLHLPTHAYIHTVFFFSFTAHSSLCFFSFFLPQTPTLTDLLYTSISLSGGVAAPAAPDLEEKAESLGARFLLTHSRITASHVCRESLWRRASFVVSEIASEILSASVCVFVCVFNQADLLTHLGVIENTPPESWRLSTQSSFSCHCVDAWPSVWVHFLVFVCLVVRAWAGSRGWLVCTESDVSLHWYPCCVLL